MIDRDFIENLGLIILAAVLFALGARWLKLPALVAYLIAGLLLGPFTDLIEFKSSLKAFSDLGVVLLLFLVGLELSFNKVRYLGWRVLLAGLAQVGGTLLLGGIASLGLGFTWVQSAFLAFAITCSSTVVAVKLLEEKKQFKEVYAQLAVGLLLFQDLIVILLLTFLAGYSADKAISISGLVTGVARSFGGMALLLVGVVAASRYVLPRPFAWAAPAPEMLFIWSLAWCVVVVAGAHWFHLSHEVGAFLAGLGLAQLPYNHDLRRRVQPLMDFLIAVFFVGLGIRMDPGRALAQWPVALLFVGLVLFGKTLLIILIVGGLGFGARTALLTSLSLAQVSEFSFILMALGLSLGLIGPFEMALIGLVGLVTIPISSCLIAYNEQIAAWLLRFSWARLFPNRREEATTPAVRRDHIIVIGMNTLGRELARRLAAAGENVLAIDTDPNKLRDLPVETMLGNVEYVAVLEEAGLRRAKLLVSALQIEETNNLLAFRAKTHGVPSSIHALDLQNLDALLEMDVAFIMLSKVDGVKLQNAELRRMGIL